MEDASVAASAIAEDGVAACRDKAVSSCHATVTAKGGDAIAPRGRKTRTIFFGGDEDGAFLPPPRRPGGAVRRRYRRDDRESCDRASDARAAFLERGEEFFRPADAGEGDDAACRRNRAPLIGASAARSTGFSRRAASAEQIVAHHHHGIGAHQRLRCAGSRSGPAGMHAAVAEALAAIDHQQR